MSFTMWKKKVTDSELFTQKCLIPSKIFSTSNLNLNDYVEVNYGTINCICRILPHFEPENSIIIDDTVRFVEKSFTIRKNKFEIPHDFNVVKLSPLIKVKIKIEFSENIDNYSLSLKQYCDLASKLVQNYVVSKNTRIKCAGKLLADLFNINSIIISDTLFGETKSIAGVICGRISKSTEVELIGTISYQQYNLNKFLDIELGGMKDSLDLLNISVQNYKKILMLGPSGSGKSTLLKKFICDTNCYLRMVGKYELLNFDKCKAICSQLINFARIFPQIHCILCIDDINQVIDNNAHFHTELLKYMIDFLDMSNVVIIVVATQKTSLNSPILNLFDIEICLGMLSYQQRRDQLSILLKYLKTENLDIDYVAQKTSGFVSRDIKILADELFRQQKKKDCCKITMQDADEILDSMTPSLLKNSNWSLKVKPVYWNDIGGMSHIKERLQMCIEKPLLNPDIFKKVDLPTPRGVLLFGPPGCCKTTIARGLATECKANFFAANPSQIYSPYVGVAEKNISELFYEARLCSPSIIFLDELDSLIGCRELDSKVVGVAEKVLSTLLIEMDGFGVSTAFGNSENPTKLMSYCGDEEEMANERMGEQVIVVAATNRPDRIDDALLRPGRFDIILYVPPPNLEERLAILKTFTNNVSLLNVDLKKIAEMTEFFSGADLKHLHATAALIGLKENEEVEYITEEHYIQALKIVRPSIIRHQLEIYERLASKYGTVITK